MTKSFWVLGLFQGLELDGGNKPIPGSAGLVLRDVATIAGVVLALTILLFVGTRYYVKHRQAHRYDRSGGGARPKAENRPVDTGEGAPRHHHRHRRRRRRRHGDSRSRNPTLAETGGLPPLRTGPEPKPPR
jgi:hypothetical protein